MAQVRRPNNQRTNPITNSVHAAGSGTAATSVLSPCSYPPSVKAVMNRLLKMPSPFQSPSAQSEAPRRFVRARLEDLDEVAAVKFQIQVGVAKPGVLEVLDPDAVVFKSMDYRC